MSPRYLQPGTVAEALGLLGELPDATLIAGGTDLMVQMKKGRRRPSTLISLARIPELAGIDAGERLRIGAAVPLRRVAAHPAVVAGHPALVQSIRVFASPQIRNVATLGGNLGNASPGADTVPPLLVYGARVELVGPDGGRVLAVEDFVVGPGRTALGPGEIIAAVVLPPPSEAARSAFMRKGRVKMDLAVASVAALVEMDGPTCAGARLAAGAVAPRPLRLTRAEARLVGSDLGAEARAAAAAAARAEVAPVSDIRATEQYRRHLVGVFVDRCLADLTATEPAAGCAR